MLDTLVASAIWLAMGQSRRAPSAKAQPQAMAGVPIDGASLVALERAMGAGSSVIRPGSPHNDGWTYWRVLGRKEMVFVYWEPAQPSSQRMVTRISFEQLHGKTCRAGVDPHLIGFWSRVHMGMSPSQLRQTLRALGTPRTMTPDRLVWSFGHLEADASFVSGRLTSVEIQEGSPR